LTQVYRIVWSANQRMSRVVSALTRPSTVYFQFKIPGKNQMKKKVNPEAPRAKSLSLAVAAVLASMSPLTTKAQTVSSPQTTEVTATSGTDITITNQGAISAGNIAIYVGANVAIGTLSNSGTINGQTVVDNWGTVATLTNNGTIISSTFMGIANETLSSIGEVSNGGLISGRVFGLGNAATLGTLNNTGEIYGGSIGVYNTEFSANSGASITALTNSGTGTITGGGTGIKNTVAIGTLTNSGLISGGTNGIVNSGTIGALSNESGGVIGGSGNSGISNSGGRIGSLTNSGTISGKYRGVSNLGGTIGTLANNGTISGGVMQGSTYTGTIGTGLMNTGTIGTLTNSGSGTISGAQYGIDDFGTIGSLVNNGLIKGGVAGFTAGGDTITTFDNAGGTIIGGTYGIDNGQLAPINTLLNSGTIAGKTGIYNASTGTIGSIVNSGLISGSANALYNAGGTHPGVLGTITNSGTIAGNIENDSANDLIVDGGMGTIFGTLTGYNGTIGTINNTASNVVFGSGNLLLNDNINVSTFSVNNTGATLQVNAPVTITGNYSQGAAATLLIGVSAGAVTTGSLSADSGYGRLVVTGNATIASGSSVSLSSRGYAFAAGQRYVVVDAAGTGTYNQDSLQYSASGFTGTITGQAVTTGGHSDLVLTLNGASTQTSTPPSPRASATVPNSVDSLRGLANYTGYNPNLMDLQNAVIAIETNGTTADANRVGAQLAPVHPSVAAQAAAAPTYNVLAVVSAHTDSLRLAAADGATPSGVSTGEAAPQSGVWGQAFGGHAGQGAIDQVDGYSANYAGLLIGADRAINDRWRAGGVFSYSNTLIDGTENSAGDSTRVNGYGLIGYASYSGTPWYVNLSGGVVQQRFDTTRQIDITGFSGIASGQFSGQQYVASVEGGWPLAVAGLTLTPLASLTYSYQHENAYTESGGNGAALAVDAAHSTSVRSALGAKLERGFETKYGMIVPDLQVKWIHEYDHTQTTTGASYAADPTGQTAFTTVGPVLVSDLADISLGVTVLRANNMTVTARYELQAAPRFVSQTGMLRLRQLF
jgi:outer membrane autotransporter protein